MRSVGRGRWGGRRFAQGAVRAIRMLVRDIVIYRGDVKTQLVAIAFISDRLQMLPTLLNEM